MNRQRDSHPGRISTGLLSTERHGRYLVLFVSLCSLGFLYPILGLGMYGLVAWNVAFWLVFIGGLRALIAKPKQRRAIGLLATFAVVAGIVALACYQSSDQGHGWVNITMSLLNLIVITFTTGLLLLDVMKGGEVTLDRIIGAGCVYVLLGLLFAFAYMTLHGFSDGALIAGRDSSLDREIPVLADYLYFSYVTLTTLGLGDITLTTMFGRLLVGVEAIVGQLYLTILVARLVGLHIVHTSHRERNDAPISTQRRKPTNVEER